jgi:DNA adenine methylase
MAPAAKSAPQATPFLRWAGSKRKALPFLAAYWSPDFTRYVEPFVGSAALFFFLAPEQAVLGDINTRLIETYTQVRDNLGQVIHALRKMRPGPTHYYHWRSISESELNPPERAAQFIYLNRFCFNGLFRTNKSGTFNVPYGGAKGGRLPSATNFMTCACQLRRAVLRAASYEETLEEARQGDFVYLDPPYQVAAQRVFREYNPIGFDTGQLKRLRQELIRLDRSSIPFLLSYAHSDEGIMLSRGFSRRTILVRRNIAGFAASRRLAAELLISNCPPKS